MHLSGSSYSLNHLFLRFEWIFINPVFSYYIYEIASQSYFTLNPQAEERASGAAGNGGSNNGDIKGPPIQKLIWAPPAETTKYRTTTNIVASSIANGTAGGRNLASDSYLNGTQPSNIELDGLNRVRQPVAFVHNFDLYYKPAIQGETVYRVTKNGKLTSSGC